MLITIDILLLLLLFVFYLYNDHYCCPALPVFQVVSTMQYAQEMVALM